MNQSVTEDKTAAEGQDPAVLKKSAGAIIAFGVILVVLGIMALGTPFIAGTATAIWVGVAMLFGGVVQLVGAFKADGWKSGLLGFLGGLLGLVAGGVLLSRPVMGLALFTLVMAVYFIVDGIFKMILAFRLRPAPGWGMGVVSGLVTLMLGVLIKNQWPLSGIWAVGTLVGIHILFTGFSMIALGSAAKKMPAEAPAA